MALSTYTWVFGEILENREQFEQDYDRAITEMADSLCPVYTSDIIAEWAELPGDKSDAWQEMIEVSNDATITGLMTLDLYSYYLDLVERAWAEVQDTHTCDTELPKSVYFSNTRITGASIAECSACGFKSAYWECACDLVHECQEEVN